MALSTIPSSGLGADASNQGVNFRNLIINGDMSIAQRGTSSSSVSGSGYYTVDRFRYGAGSGIVNTFSQSTDVPSGQGFKYSHKQEATTGDASLGADEYNIFQQRLEGYMFQSAKFGTSNAESLTLSFWIKASVTGTYVCELHNIDADVSQSQSYTVSSADTWEKKTITFSGDTSNAISIDNGRGLDLNWWLGAGTNFSSGTLQTTWGTQVSANRAVGATNAFASNNDTVFLTGVQLEVGTTASDFEFLPYDVNLRRCQRYYEKSYDVNTVPSTNTSNGIIIHSGSSNQVGNIQIPLIWKTPKRTSPSITSYTEAGTSGQWGYGRDGANGDAGTGTGATGENSTRIFLNIGSNWAVGNAGGHYVADAEL